MVRDESAAERVRRAWHRHLGDDDRLCSDVLERHREPHRRYHTVEHVAAVIESIGSLAEREPVADLAVVVAAAMYHDAIYDPNASSNESASAQLAERDLRALGWTDRRCRRVATMIDGTATHTDPPDADTAVLFDADLAILGADPTAYGRYVDHVRAEYGHVDDVAWATGRASVLRSFLDREAIYATPLARERWERQARINLERELEALGGGISRGDEGA